MARIRFIKPEFFLHEKLSDLSPLHRLLFVGLWTLADKDGRLEDRPKRIKVEVLPYDDCDLDAMLNDLDACEFIHRYEANGERYIAIPGWSKHQKPHPKEQSRKLPEPPSREIKRQAVKFNGKDVSSREKIIASKVDSGFLSLESGVLSLDSGEKLLSASADESNAKAESPKNPTNSRHASTIAIWVRLWKDLRGGDYRVAGAKDASAVKRLLTYPEATDAEIELRARRALADGWFRQNGNLALFVSQWSKWEPPSALPLFAQSAVNDGFVDAEEDFYGRQAAEADARHAKEAAHGN